MADERAHKQTVDEIVLRESYTGFRSLNKMHHGNMDPRLVLNANWVAALAEKHSLTAKEIDEAIDRLDGKFHWQIG